MFPRLGVVRRERPRLRRPWCAGRLAATRRTTHSDRAGRMARVVHGWTRHVTRFVTCHVTCHVTRHVTRHVAVDPAGHRDGGSGSKDLGVRAPQSQCDAGEEAWQQLSRRATAARRLTMRSRPAGPMAVTVPEELQRSREPAGHTTRPPVRHDGGEASVPSGIGPCRTRACLGPCRAGIGVGEEWAAPRLC